MDKSGQVRITKFEDDYDCLDEVCDHEDYETDILTGRASCNMCGHSWYQTAEEIDREYRRIATYYEWERRQHSLWYRALDWLCELPRRVQWRLWPRKPKRAALAFDDDIPF